MEQKIMNRSETDSANHADRDADCQTPDILTRDYRFIRLLGEGTSGRTYLAERRSDFKRVAIKVLKAGSTFKSMDLFKREAKTLKSIKVKGVPAFYGFIRPMAASGEAYLIQEYIEFPSLQTYLDKGKVFTEEEVRRIGIAIAKILKKLETEYSPAIIHRDIKPSNVLYDEYGEACYLIDFGAVANPQHKSMGSTVAGTVGYMAPEQLLGECTIQSDYYALGATMLALLTGISPAEMPHDKNNPFKLNYEEYLKDVSIEMKRFLSGMLSEKCSDRPKSIHAAFELLKSGKKKYVYGRREYVHALKKVMAMMISLALLSFINSIRLFDFGFIYIIAVILYYIPMISLISADYNYACSSESSCGDENSKTTKNYSEHAMHAAKKLNTALTLMMVLSSSVIVMNAFKFEEFCRNTGRNDVTFLNVCCTIIPVIVLSVKSFGRAMNSEDFTKKLSFKNKTDTIIIATCICAIILGFSGAYIIDVLGFVLTSLISTAVLWLVIMFVTGFERLLFGLGVRRKGISYHVVGNKPNRSEIVGWYINRDERICLSCMQSLDIDRQTWDVVNPSEWPIEPDEKTGALR